MKLFPVALFAACAALPAGAEPDALRGAEIAAEYCARCHDTSAEGAFKQHPPSFAAIARFRPVEQIEARIWFPSVHGPMPQMAHVLDPSSVEDLVAFILSLE